MSKPPNYEMQHFLQYFQHQIDQLRFQVDSLAETVQQHLQAPTPASTTTTTTQLTLTPYDGNILNFPLFWSSYLSQMALIPTATHSTLFNLLYSNLDSETRILLLSDLDPLSPDIELAIERVEQHFSNHEFIRNSLEQSINNYMPVLKNTYDNAQWLAFLEVAKKATVLINRYLDPVWDQYFAPLLNRKLAPIHQNRIWEKLGPDAKTSLKTSIAYAEEMIQKNMQTLKNLKIQTFKAAENLCPLCELDYHFADYCDQYPTVQERKELIQDRKSCRRCLGERYVRGKHSCGLLCLKCGKDHHVALCDSM